MISNTKKFIYIHINKCGGTSLTDVLKEHAVDFEGKKIGYKKHSTMQQVYDVIGSDLADSYYKFTVIRNPLDRISSFYRHITRSNSRVYKKMNGKFDITNFDKFINNLPDLYKSRSDYGISLISMTEWLMVNGKIKIDKIIKLEDLNSEYKNLSNNFGLESNLKKLNQDPIQIKHASLYTSEMKNIVKSIYKDDFKNFNYE